jgi:hypothetical protein
MTSFFDPYFAAPRNLRIPTPRPADLPPLDTSLVDFDKLYDYGATVFEPVPEDERQKYRYWRGAHIGKIAMNFARGDQRLNAGYDNTCHFAENYTYALNTAKSTIRKNQLTDEDKLELSAATGQDVDAPLPRIVFALDQAFNEDKFAPSQEGQSRGIVLVRRLTLDMIDPHSRELLTQLLAEPET